MSDDADERPSEQQILALRDRVCTERGLEVLERFPEGSTGWVGLVRRTGDPDGSSDGSEPLEGLVLKVTWAHEESRDEALGLRAWSLSDSPAPLVPRVIEARRHGAISVILLEQVHPGTTLARSALSPEQEDEVAAGLLRSLWIPASELPTAASVPAGAQAHGFRPLSAMCAWWAEEARHRLETDARGLPAPLIARGLGMFRTLPLETPGPDMLLATDFHHHNVLAAREDPGTSLADWRMIDPKPYVGDPHYDLLQHMLNDDRRLTADPLGFATRMAGLTGLDAERTLRWLLARCVQEAGSMPGAAEGALQLAEAGV
ncbi:kinase [Brachybacterium endophyticum]|uniref:Kinase n=1 Tax=Brachybacterium endophyticum TaxID=2182385 RepID=A0A2U2RN55_9MICO|nr:aminoglycoside phosphotransferase family protein [Brachybacterium endophyticum]PWH07300.1 kinase [Brachybacterium endophyticum]